MTTIDNPTLKLKLKRKTKTKTKTKDRSQHFVTKGQSTMKTRISAPCPFPSLRSLAAGCLALGVLLSLGGCVTATVQAVREANTGINVDDSIVVLGRRSRPTSNETEFNFVNCVSRKMNGGANSIPVVNEQAFRDALFPWFEPRTAPGKATDLAELLREPVLANRLQEIGLRYLVWVEGSTQRVDQGGSLSCSVTPGGAGCFGFLTWENDSSYEAQIWDVRTGRQAGKVSSDANGTSYMPAVVVPIPMIARVQLSACNSLGTQLKTFLRES